MLTIAHPVVGAYYAPHLPPRLASHFGFSGAPDGWMSRGAFLLAMIGVALLMLALFVVSSRVTVWSRDEWINLPHKAFWLAPERRAQTMERIERHTLRMGVATQALLLLVFEQVLRTNAIGSNHLGAPVRIFLLVYCAVMAWLLVSLVREFARPTAAV